MSTPTDEVTSKPSDPRPTKNLDSAIIRFTGDSGDGMQLTGTQFTNTAAVMGNDLATFPDYPAEIRAPAGTTFGVSGFQLNFSDHSIYTAGDQPDVLIAMNPAALKVNLPDLKSGGILILNTDAFTKQNVERAGYDKSPLDDGSLDSYRTFKIAISTQTEGALKETGLTFKEVLRAKNFWTLGLLYYLYGRSLELTVDFINAKFKGKQQVAEGNRLALKAGYLYGEISEIFQETYRVSPAKQPPGTYRNITGNEATAWGAIAAAKKADLPLFYGSYPITPASDVLHVLSGFKHYGATTFQAEDEIAAVCSAIGAAFAGNLALTGSSGPGIALKAEAIGLAVAAELPMVVINVQRGGPSTGLPTKTEQADLLQTMYGRNGECPLPIVAASTPSDCFEAMMEACRLALKYMVPVFLLTDGYLANGAEPWRIPDEADLPDVKGNPVTEAPEGFHPFMRDDKTLARIWPIPGSKGMEHRIGGLERSYDTGHISYDPDNHEKMSHVRQDKVDRIADDIEPAVVEGSQSGGKLLMLGWGSTFGAIRQGVLQSRKAGLDVSHVHLRHINPMPANLGDILSSFDKVVVPEMNLGQLRRLVRDKYLTPATGLNKIQGKPFKVEEILACIRQELA
jgi:2-oxoglutarate ferredoxin oxidoreductase subunit alpha